MQPSLVARNSTVSCWAYSPECGGGLAARADGQQGANRLRRQGGNYTNLFAEFVLRVCATLRNQRHDDLSIRPIAALVELPEQDARSYIEQQQYTTRMNDVLKRSALREGWSDDARHWSVESPDLRPGSRPQLQVCDVSSNARTWNGCSKCGPEARAQLLASLRQFDFTLQVWPLVDQ